MDYYITENLHLASFLRSQGIDLREIRWSPGREFQKCEFVLRVDKSAPKLLLLIARWNDSEEARLFKCILHQINILKGELINFMNQNKNG